MDDVRGLEELWAFGLLDLRLSDEAFGRLTLPQFWKLWDRRQMIFKRQCYLAGIGAAAIYNVNRTSPEQQVFNPDDFVPRSQAEAERENLVRSIRKMIGGLSLTEQKVWETFSPRLIEMGVTEAEAQDILEECIS